MEMLYSVMKPFLGDQQALMERMAGRLDVWEECVLLFPREEIIKEMDEALDNNAFSSLYGCVHRLKGNLANFGFDAASKLAKEVLAALREEDIPLVQELYKGLREAYRQIIERIGECQ